MGNPCNGNYSSGRLTSIVNKLGATLKLSVLINDAGTVHTMPWCVCVCVCRCA